MADLAATRAPVRRAVLLGLESVGASSGSHGKIASRAQRI
jgi:hypothetical protein